MSNSSAISAGADVLRQRRMTRARVAARGAAAFVGDGVRIADSQRERRVVIEEERRDVVVVDEEQHVRPLLPRATARSAGTLRRSAPTPGRPASSCRRQSRWSVCAMSRSRQRWSPQCQTAPHTSRAVSTTSRNFAACDSSAMSLPCTVLENPHCGDRQSWSSGTSFAAASMRRFEIVLRPRADRPWC